MITVKTPNGTYQVDTEDRELAIQHVRNHMSTVNNKPPTEERVSHTQGNEEKSNGLLSRIGQAVDNTNKSLDRDIKGLSDYFKEKAVKFKSDIEQTYGNKDPWQRQQAVLRHIDKYGIPVIINALQAGGVPETLISKITNMKQSGMKFGDIMKNLSQEEAKLAMNAIQPPSLVQKEVQRITPAMGLR